MTYSSELDILRKKRDILGDKARKKTPTAFILVLVLVLAGTGLYAKNLQGSQVAKNDAEQLIFSPEFSAEEKALIQDAFSRYENEFVDTTLVIHFDKLEKPNIEQGLAPLLELIIFHNSVDSSASWDVEKQNRIHFLDDDISAYIQALASAEQSTMKPLQSRPETLASASRTEHEFTISILPLDYFQSEKEYKRTVTHELAHVTITLTPEYLKNIPYLTQFHAPPMYYRDDDKRTYSQILPIELSKKIYDINTYNQQKKTAGFVSHYANTCTFYMDMVKSERELKETLSAVIESGKIDTLLDAYSRNSLQAFPEPGSESDTLKDAYLKRAQEFIDSVPDANHPLWFKGIKEIDHGNEDIAETVAEYLYPLNNGVPIGAQAKLVAIHSFLEEIYKSENVKFKAPSINEQQYDIIGREGTTYKHYTQ